MTAMSVTATQVMLRVRDGDDAAFNYLVERYRQRALMVLPLAVRDQAIGAVMLSDERGPRGRLPRPRDRLVEELLPRRRDLLRLIVLNIVARIGYGYDLHV